jgi:hypothetical protein
MKIEVSTSIEELKKQFNSTAFTIREDGQGGAHVVMESVPLGPRYRPETTWIGFHIPAQYPYADIYPVFIGSEVSRVDGVEFAAPVTRGHVFLERSAIQVSRRSGTAQNGLQKV